MRTQVRLGLLVAVALLLAGCYVSPAPAPVVYGQPQPVSPPPGPPVAVAPAPAYVPEYYVWDGFEYVGWIGNVYVFWDGIAWSPFNTIVIGHFHDYERYHPQWRGEARRYDSHEWGRGRGRH